MLLLGYSSALPEKKGSFDKSLPHNKISDWSKLKAFSDDKLGVVKMMISVFDPLENTMGKGKNAG